MFSQYRPFEQAWTFVIKIFNSVPCVPDVENDQTIILLIIKRSEWREKGGSTI
jgi:hypothetical protein